MKDASVLYTSEIMLHGSKLQPFGCLPRGVVGFHSIHKPRLTGAPIKKRTGEVRSDPRSAASGFLEDYGGWVSHGVYGNQYRWRGYLLLVGSLYL